MKETLQRLTGIHVEDRDQPRPGVAVGIKGKRFVLSTPTAIVLILGIIGAFAYLEGKAISKWGRPIPIKQLWDGPNFGGTNDFRKVAEERHADVTNRLQRIEDKVKETVT